MKKIFFENIRKILQFKNKVEQSLNVKIKLEPGFVLVEGSALDEDIAEDIFEAILLGFDQKIALTLREEGVSFEKVNIKRYVRESRVRLARARIIGKEGRAKKTISELTGCAIAIKDNTVGIIGKTDDLDIALLAVTSLIRGKPHAKVYASLERTRAERKFVDEEDLGLKTDFIGKSLSKRRKIKPRKSEDFLGPEKQGFSRKEAL